MESFNNSKFKTADTSTNLILADSNPLPPNRPGSHQAFENDAETDRGVFIKEFSQDERDLKKKIDRERIKTVNYVGLNLCPGVGPAMKGVDLGPYRNIIHQGKIIRGVFESLSQTLAQFYENQISYNEPATTEKFLKVHMRELIASLKYLWLKLSYHHLDIKPDNIMIANSDLQSPLLIDFENPLQPDQRKTEKTRFTFAFASYDINQRKADSDSITECKHNEDLLQLGYTFLYLISTKTFFSLLDVKKETEARFQEVADMKLRIEAEPNILKLKKHLMTIYKIDKSHEGFVARLAKYFTLVALFDEHLEDLPDFFDSLGEIFI